MNTSRSDRRARLGRARWRVGVIGALVLALVLGGGVSPASADPSKTPADWRPKAQEWKKLPHLTASEGEPLKLKIPKASKPAGVKPVVSGHFTVKTDGSKGRKAWVRAGRTPIELRGPESAKVEVLPTAEVIDAGGVGLAFTVDAPQGAEVRIDTAALADAGFAAAAEDRLRVVELPSCYATSPDDPECSVPVKSLETSREGDEKSLVAALPKSSAGAGATVFAVAAGVDGASGSFAAQPLAPSSSWSAGSSTGDFTWAYPLGVPSLGLTGGLVPDVALTYSSSVVDGRVASSNNQPGLIGQGWSYEAGFIERRYVTCKDHPAGGAGNTADLCWAGEALFLNFGGHSGELVRDDASGVWKLRADDGTRVERLTGAPSGAKDGEHWRLTTPDGTKYLFGSEALPGRTDQTLTGATWTVPVYGAHAGDPCYSSSGFASSRCVQGWRWNLDYVEDVHGNAMAYYYSKETNHYSANLGTSRVAYTRGGVPSRIDYGLRNSGGSVYGTVAEAQVVFTAAERCIPSSSFTCDPLQFTPANADHWPDTPQDLRCEGDGACTVVSPTFWTRLRITAITTKARNSAGTFVTRDVWNLTQTYPDLGDDALWLQSIKHTTYTPSGASIVRGPVEFGGDLLDNRVAGYSGYHGMLMWRLVQIKDENGAILSVTYTPKDCTASSVPSTTDLSANTRRCFPVRWPMNGTMKTDFFHKYLVSSVMVQDSQAASPGQLTTYQYVGTPAWHFDDNELVKAGERTWSQFRGYAQVNTLTGNPSNSSNGAADARTLTKTYYLRGMNGDKLSAGGTRSVTVTNSRGETIVDSDQYAGAAYESQSFLKETDTTPAAKTITDFATYATTATRARTGLGSLVARVTGVAKQRSYTATAAGGWLNSTVTYTRDARGREISASTLASGAESTCTTTSYAENTSRNILATPAEVATYADACPSSGAPTSKLLSGARTYYDGSTTLGAVPGIGNPTRTDTAVAASEWAKSTAAFDSYGRLLTSTVFTSASDTTGRTSTTAYTPATGGPVTKVTVTNALGQSSETHHDLDGMILKQVDVAGRITEATYDALGRITDLWEPGFPKSGPATQTFAYTNSPTDYETITTKTTTAISGTTPTQVTSVALYDAFGQLLQTQTGAVGGGRIVDDTFYDSHGWAVRTNNRWYTAGDPAKTRISTADSGINSRTTSTYDALGRPTTVISYKGVTETRRTTTVYSGDQTTVFPPAAAPITASVVNGLGQTLKKLDYVTAPTVSGNVVSGGTFTTTSYAYDGVGQLVRLTDPIGAVWYYTYDAGGRRTKAVDPDTGTTNTSYNHLGEKTTVVDARGTAGTLKYTYDKLGRMTKLVGGSGDKLIGEWVFDTLKPGQLTETKSYIDGDTANPFVEKVTGYDAYARPTGSSLVVPANQGALAGTYSASVTYTNTGQVATQTLPALGGLPAETVTRTYTPQGLPNATTGTNKYVNSTSYTPHGLPSQTVGREGDSLVQSVTYNVETLAVDNTYLNGATTRPQIQAFTYVRNASGQIVRTAQSANFNSPAKVRTMCYRYDTRARLTDAWTSNDDCVANPSSTASTTYGFLPMWHQWTHNDAGVRTKETKNKVVQLPAATTTTTYALGVTGHAHAIASQTSTPTGGTGTTTTYTYDSAGNTTSSTTGGITESLAWNTLGKVASTSKSGKTTSYLYSAGGSILMRKDPNGSTVYTPAGELRLTGTSTKTGTRFYSHNGRSVAQRVGAAVLQALDGDQTGTASVAVDWSDLSKTTWRYHDPYGNRIDGLGTWQTDHTYLDRPTDTTTGYVQTGARLYNPKVGRFLSVDPVLDAANTQTLNGYGYTAADPINSHDATGLNPRNYHQNPDANHYVTTGGRKIEKTKANLPSVKPRAVQEPKTRPANRPARPRFGPSMVLKLLPKLNPYIRLASYAADAADFIWNEAGLAEQWKESGDRLNEERCAARGHAIQSCNAEMEGKIMYRAGNASRVGPVRAMRDFGLPSEDASQIVGPFAPGDPGILGASASLNKDMIQASGWIWEAPLMDLGPGLEWVSAPTIEDSSHILIYPTRELMVSEFDQAIMSIRWERSFKK
ncbi:MAG: RHS repeat-associated core domain-containing protein [Arachnia sp.]